MRFMGHVDTSQDFIGTLKQIKALMILTEEMKKSRLEKLPQRCEICGTNSSQIRIFIMMFVCLNLLKKPPKWGL